MGVTNFTTARMIRPGFDTNILVYSIDLRDLQKHNLSRMLVRRCGLLDGVLSIQCLTEFYRATTRKKILSTTMAFDVVLETKDAFDIVSPNETDLLRAMQGHAVFGTQFFDSLMMATLDRGGCTTVFSEDFSHGQMNGNLTILNPFKLSPEELDHLLT